jgi:hypothetical protein
MVWSMKRGSEGESVIDGFRHHGERMRHGRSRIQHKAVHAIPLPFLLVFSHQTYNRKQRKR